MFDFCGRGLELKRVVKLVFNWVFLELDVNYFFIIKWFFSYNIFRINIFFVKIIR